MTKLPLIELHNLIFKPKKIAMNGISNKYSFDLFFFKVLSTTKCLQSKYFGGIGT
jgi:hypothetical protein